MKNIGFKKPELGTMYGLTLPGFPVMENLISYYKLDSADSNLIIDELGFNNGTRVGGTIVPSGKFENCYSSTGATSDYLNLNNINEVKLSIGSVSAWFKTSNAGSSFRAIIVKQHAYGVFLDNNKLIFYSWAAPAGSKTSNILVNDNQWHHVVHTFSAGVTNGSKLYLDGVLVHSNTMTINNQTVPLVIGAGGTGGQNFIGQIDEVGVWNRELSQEEVTALYNNGDGVTYAEEITPTPPLDYPVANRVAHYKLDTLTEVTDSINGNHGTRFNINTTQPGRFGESYVFNGVNSYITIPDHDNLSAVSPTGNTAFSISMWIRFNMSGDRWLINKRDASTGDEWQFIRYQNNLRAMFWNTDGTTVGYTKANWNPTLNQFDNFVISFDPTRPNHILVYQNGVELGGVQDGIVSTLRNSTMPVTIGKAGWDNAFWFNGYIDDISIWKGRALTQADVNMIYNGNAGNYVPYTLVQIAPPNSPQPYTFYTHPQVAGPDFPMDSLVSYYKMDETSGTVATDAMNLNHGNIVGTLINAAGKINTGYNFLGNASNRIDFNSFTSITQSNFTICFWAKQSVQASPCVFSQSIPTTWANNLFIFYVGESTSEVRIWWSGANVITYTGSPGTSNVFKHYLLRRTGDLFELFINGILVTSGTRVANWTSSYQGIGTAKNNTTLTQHYKGLLDELAIWNRALTAEQISQVYNNGNGRTL